MRFLADESFPKVVAVAIGKFGHSVRTVQQKGINSSSDEIVGDVAQKERRILLTFDKDFLERKINSSLVIVFYFPKVPIEDILVLLDGFINELEKLKLSRYKILKFSKSGLEVIK